MDYNVRRQFRMNRIIIRGKLIMHLFLIIMSKKTILKAFDDEQKYFLPRKPFPVTYYLLKGIRFQSQSLPYK